MRFWHAAEATAQRWAPMERPPGTNPRADLRAVPDDDPRSATRWPRSSWGCSSWPLGATGVFIVRDHGDSIETIARYDEQCDAELPDGCEDWAEHELRDIVTAVAAGHPALWTDRDFPGCRPMAAWPLGAVHRAGVTSSSSSSRRRGHRRSWRSAAWALPTSSPSISRA